MSKRAAPIVAAHDGPVIGYMIFCPACQNGHAFWTDAAGKPKWTFSGDVERPTFSHSMLVQTVHYPSGGPFPTDEEYERIQRGEQIKGVPYVCHSFVEDGKIRFLGDCTHALAGQTVELPPFPGEEA